MTYIYNLDPTGTNPANHIQNESHTLPNQAVRLFATDFGGFFVDSLVVVDKATMQPLDKDVDYYATSIFELPTALYDSEICSVVVVTNPAVSDNLSVSYQALGGFYSKPATDIVQQIGGICQKYVRDWTHWGNLLKPPYADENPPTHYSDRNNERIGFEYLTHAISRINQLKIGGYSDAYQDLYKYLDDKFAASGPQLSDATDLLNTHIAKVNNPHQTSLTQLNVWSKAQADGALATMSTTITTKKTSAQTSVNAHTGDYNNPHQLSANGLGIYTKAQVNANMQKYLSNSGYDVLCVGGLWQIDELKNSMGQVIGTQKTLVAAGFSEGGGRDDNVDHTTFSFGYFNYVSSVDNAPWGDGITTNYLLSSATMPKGFYFRRRYGTSNDGWRMKILDSYGDMIYNGTIIQRTLGGGTGGYWIPNFSILPFVGMNIYLRLTPS